MDADREFFIGDLGCYAQDDMLIKVGARQLTKKQQFTVRMRVDEDREEAVRRYVSRPRTSGTKPPSQVLSIAPDRLTPTGCRPLAAAHWLPSATRCRPPPSAAAASRRRRRRRQISTRRSCMQRVPSLPWRRGS